MYRVVNSSPDVRHANDGLTIRTWQFHSGKNLWSPKLGQKRWKSQKNRFSYGIYGSSCFQTGQRDYFFLPWQEPWNIKTWLGSNFRQNLMTYFVVTSLSTTEHFNSFYWAQFSEVQKSMVLLRHLKLSTYYAETGAQFRIPCAPKLTFTFSAKKK